MDEVEAKATKGHSTRSWTEVATCSSTRSKSSSAANRDHGRRARRVIKNSGSHDTGHGSEGSEGAKQSESCARARTHRPGKRLEEPQQQRSSAHRRQSAARESKEPSKQKMGTYEDGRASSGRGAMPIEAVAQPSSKEVEDVAETVEAMLLRLRESVKQRQSKAVEWGDMRVRCDRLVDGERALIDGLSMELQQLQGSKGVLAPAGAVSLPAISGADKDQGLKGGLDGPNAVTDVAMVFENSRTRSAKSDTRSTIPKHPQIVPMSSSSSFTPKSISHMYEERGSTEVTQGATLITSPAATKMPSSSEFRSLTGPTAQAQRIPPRSVPAPAKAKAETSLQAKCSLATSATPHNSKPAVSTQRAWKARERRWKRLHGNGSHMNSAKSEQTSSEISLGGAGDRCQVKTQIAGASVIPGAIPLEEPAQTTVRHRVVDENAPPTTSFGVATEDDVGGRKNLLSLSVLQQKLRDGAISFRQYKSLVERIATLTTPTAGNSDVDAQEAQGQSGNIDSARRRVSDGAEGDKRGSEEEGGSANSESTGSVSAPM